MNSIPYVGWRPYCLVCSTMIRMHERPYGYQCAVCDNKITHNLTHHDGGSHWTTAKHNQHCSQCDTEIKVGEDIYINGEEALCDGCGDPMDPGTNEVV